MPKQVYRMPNLMAPPLTQTLCRATLKEKSYKKVQARHDRSAHPCVPSPPRCLRGSFTVWLLVRLAIVLVGFVGYRAGVWDCRWHREADSIDILKFNGREY